MGSIFDGLNYSSSLTAQLNTLRQSNSSGAAAGAGTFDEILNAILATSNNDGDDLFADITSIESQISTLNDSTLPADPKEFLLSIQQNYLSSIDSFLNATRNDSEEEEDSNFDLFTNTASIDAQLNVLKYQSGDSALIRDPDEFLLSLQQNYAGLIDNFTSSGSDKNDAFSTWTNYQNSVNSLTNLSF